MATTKEQKTQANQVSVGDSPFAKKTAVIGAIVGVVVTVGQRETLQLGSEEAALVGGLAGLVCGTMVGYLILDPDDSLKNACSYIGGACGALLALYTLGTPSFSQHIEPGSWAPLILLWVGTAIGAWVGRMIWALSAMVALVALVNWRVLLHVFG